MRTKLILLLMVWCIVVQAQKAKPVKAQKPKERLYKYYVYCQAEYPGGYAALKKCVDSLIRYPEAAREAGVQGTAKVKFVIDSTGYATNITSAWPIGAGCDEELKKIVAAMPRWQPATFNGKPVKSLYYLPISFRLE